MIAEGHKQAAAAIPACQKWMGQTQRAMRSVRVEADARGWPAEPCMLDNPHADGNAPATAVDVMPKADGGWNKLSYLDNG